MLEPSIIRSSDVSINVSLIDDVNVTLNITVSILILDLRHSALQLLGN